MKKTKFLLFACLACLLAVACEKDDEESARQKTFDKFVMGDTRFTSEDGTKVALEFSTNRLLYEVGDIIKINGETFTLSKTGSGASTEWYASGNSITASEFYCAYVDGVATTLSNYSGSTYHFNIAGRLSSATNKVIMAGVTDSNVLTLNPVCAIIRLPLNDSYTNVKVGFERNKVYKEGDLSISRSGVTFTGTTYMTGVDQNGTGADFLKMEYNTIEGYWYVAVPVSSQISTKLYFYWEQSGTPIGYVTSGQVTLQKGWVYTAGTSRQSPFYANGTSKGVFNVSGGKQVRFSAGNLQAMRTINPATGNYTYKWQFANNQKDYIGSSNGANIQNNDVWFDLFGYGTSGYNAGQNARMPNSTSTTASDYIATAIANTSSDWGNYLHTYSNYKLYYGNTEVSSENWRTLTSDEWTYLIGRTDKAGLATVAGQQGLILLPDYFPGGWALPDGVSFTATFSNYTTNSYDATNWDKLEAAGAIFLPVTGYRNGTTVSSISNGYYWSTSAPTSERGNPAPALVINGSSTATTSTNRFWGCAIRLVVEIEEE
ncbi:MAG: hypothetical protein J5677_04230 [Bacteroidales bacterium]|nr:hypothetical protein [Bacteroidales bacterium]